jgi:cytochrome o ubiquinol oxidase subunit 3
MQSNNSPVIAYTREASEQATMGFWVFILGDCLLFGSLFATYAVLHGATAGYPSGRELFDLPFVLRETLVLLASSFTAGLAYLAAQSDRIRLTLLFLVSTLALGVWFLQLEFSEFATLIAEGAGPDKSAFLSSYFGLLGTHGAHVLFGAIWLLALIFQVRTMGIKSATLRRLSLFALFWHFLDIVWIFIFSFVYLFALL